MPRSLKHLSWAFLGLCALLSCRTMQAQTFASVPAIAFTKIFAGADPLRQNLTINSVGAGFNFRVTEGKFIIVSAAIGSRRHFDRCMGDPEA